MRRPKRWFSIGAVCLVAFAACMSDTTPVPSSPVTGLSVPTTSSQLSLNLIEPAPGAQYGINFGGDYLSSLSNDFRANDFRAARTMRGAGVRFARIAAYWAELQQGEDNTFNSTALANLHNLVDALDSAGITPYITLYGTACFARSIPFPCSTAETHLPPDAAHESTAWTTYVRQMMHEFRGVRYWGIWNEPNSGDFLLPDGGDRLAAYKRLVELAAPAIRDSGRLVIGPDLGDGEDFSSGVQVSAQQWLRSFLSTHGTYVDIVAVHLYGATADPSLLQNEMSGYAQALALYPQLDLWLTETAYPADANKVNADDALQAANLKMVYNTMNSRVVPRWTKTFYYNAGSFDAPGHHVGIVRNLGTTSQVPRPAYDSLKAIANPTLKATIVGPFTIGAFQEGTWQGFITGGTPPYSYGFRINSTVVATNVLDYTYVNQGSDFVVTFFVTDALGASSVLGIGVTVGAPCNPCQ